MLILTERHFDQISKHLFSKQYGRNSQAHSIISPNNILVRYLFYYLIFYNVFGGYGRSRLLEIRCGRRVERLGTPASIWAPVVRHTGIKFYVCVPRRPHTTSLLAGGPTIVNICPHRHSNPEKQKLSRRRTTYYPIAMLLIVLFQGCTSL